MSALARLDKYSLVRGFNTCYGITPWRYLEALRVNLGQQMLGKARNCGSGHKLRFYGSKPFFKMLQGQDRHNSRRIQKSSLPAQDFSNPIGSKTLQGFTSCAWEEVETPPRLTASV